MLPPTKTRLSISGLFGIAVATAALFAGPGVHRAQAQILQYTFNDTGTTATNTGSLAGANLTFENSAGTPTDLHSAAGGGVSGLPTDVAFNNTGATGQGSAGVGGAAFSTAVSPFNGLASFTLTGWYNASSAPFGSGARLVISGSQAFSLNFNSASLALLVTTTGTSNTVTTANTIANTPNSWVYFAATYDGASLKLYLGNTVTTATSVSTVSASGTTNAGSSIYVGNVLALNRPFQGSVDNIRLYGSALSLAQVDAIQTADEVNLPAPVPEPSSFIALGVLALGGFALRRRLKVV